MRVLYRLTRRVDGEECEEERERERTEEYPRRAKKGEAAEDPRQDEERVKMHTATYEPGPKEVVDGSHRNRAPEREPDSRGYIAGEEGKQHNGDENECRTDAGDERREEGGGPPEDWVRHPEEGEAGHREHSLRERGEEVTAHHRVNSEPEALEYKLLVSGGERADAHHGTLEALAVTQEIVQADEEDEEPQEERRQAREGGAEVPRHPARGLARVDIDIPRYCLSHVLNTGHIRREVVGALRERAVEGAAPTARIKREIELLRLARHPRGQERDGYDKAHQAHENGEQRRHALPPAERPVDAPIERVEHHREDGGECKRYQERLEYVEGEHRHRSEEPYPEAVLYPTALHGSS